MTTLKDIINDRTMGDEERITTIMHMNESWKEKQEAILEITSQRASYNQRALAELRKVDEKEKQREHEENIQKLKDNAKIAGKAIGGFFDGALRLIGSSAGKIASGARTATSDKNPLIDSFVKGYKGQ